MDPRETIRTYRDAGAIATGGASGIGRALSEELTKRGSSVVIADRQNDLAIALSCSNRLILPVMADDSSRRAVQNAFALVLGINLPAPIYLQYFFSSRLHQANRNLPQIGPKVA